jgi:2-polyprenyl-3-methyl-5-hydroxy-6-metoxy-1,4-benzoquinol methylase
MNKDLRNKLFDNYSSRTNNLDSSYHEKYIWFNTYFKNFYKPFISTSIDKNLNILDIGCNRGYLLKVLKDNGYENLVGIDLSNDDLEHAKKLELNCPILNVDAFDYLEENKLKFDVIIIKAVLEHIPKDKVGKLIQLMYESLTNEGVLIIDVPNMDWLFASHERYMDFTHEVGFTKESIEQVLRLHFDKYKITTGDNIFHTNTLSRIRTKIARKFIQKVLGWADPEGVSNPIWNRSLIAVGFKN